MFKTHYNMASERFKIIPAVFLFLKKENQILLQRRMNTGYADGWYDVPSGHVEEGELPIYAVIREGKEETGVVVEEKDLLFLGSDYTVYDDRTYLHLYYVTEEWRGEAKILEPGKCDDIQWFSFDQLPEKVVLHVKAALAHLMNNTIPFYYETVA